MSLSSLEQIHISFTDRFVAVAGNATAWLGILSDPSAWTVIGGVGVSGATCIYFLMKSLHERQRMVQEQELHELKMEREKQKDMEGDIYG